MKDSNKIALLGTLLSKKYARSMFELLKAYKDISASEASSRLGLHVQTIQEFLDGTADLGLSEKYEVTERKRPYFRYKLIKNNLNLKFIVDEFIGSDNDEKPQEYLLREKKNPGTQFTIARSGNYFSTVSVMIGSGRERKQRKINLTTAQGKFLYFLPYPDADPLPLQVILEKSGVDKVHRKEIENLIKDLEELKVLEIF